jgi:6-pyruvoyltetrahydropterin/6-carboxytetrahydropterin synthase
MNPETGYVFHFEELAHAVAEAREALDHRLLNEVEGLGTPTLERIAVWLWNRLQNRVPGLAEIEVARDSCQEGCVYRGPEPSMLAAAE